MNNKLIIFAPEFYPVIGGITEFTFQLAKAIHRADRLDFLFTLYEQKKDCEFDYLTLDFPEAKENHWQNKGIFRRIRSYFLLQKRKRHMEECLNRAFSTSSPIIINSLFMQESWRVIEKCISKKKLYIPVIHGLDIIENQVNRPKEFNQMLNNSHVIIVNSEATKYVLLKNYPKLKTKIDIIYPPFDKEEYEDAKKGRAMVTEVGNKLQLISICRLVPRKGIDIAIRGVQKAVHDGVQVKYIIGGKGPELETLRGLVYKLELHPYIEVRGEITESEKFELLACGDVFIMPNHSMNEKDFEGFGISFVEAQYFENFVIGGKSGGAVESISSDYGFHVDFCSDSSPEDQIARKLKHLYDHKDELNQSKKEARKFVEERFEISTLVESLRSNKTLSAD